MGKVIANISISLDGFIAGLNPTLEEPLGVGGENLHEWVVSLESWRQPHGLQGGETGPDNDIMKASAANIGAVIMGRKMYSGGEGPWESDQNADGWWGDNPPFKSPVFVLTSHPRESVSKQGGTSFTFVTDGAESALEQAIAKAGEKDISIAGGASTIQQFLRTRLADELHIHLVPILLGSGVKLLSNLGEIKLDKLSVVDTPKVTHFKFRIVK